MTNAVENFWDSLSKDEADYVQAIMDKLKDRPWSAPVVAGIRDNGGIVQANKDRMFELRFGYALDQVGIVPQYEIPGEGQSTIDFGFTSGGQRWCVEMVRLGETQAVKDATGSSVDADGVPWTGRTLRTGAEDPKQSLEGETLKAVERICQKCESKGRPHKFPAPDGAYHAMLVDFRTFMNGGDIYDRIHVALGAAAVAPQYRLFWNQRPITASFATKRMCGARRRFANGCTSWVSCASACTVMGNSRRRRNSSPIRICSPTPPPRAPRWRHGRCNRRI